jgi:5'-nucleotidase/UDP-sugar diphosphatase
MSTRNPVFKSLSLALWQIGLIQIFTNSAHAEPLWIIHTTDLHSHFEHSQDPNLGGYAAVRAKIEELKRQAAEQNIPTLVLDAGDFSEGSQFHFFDKGFEPWKMLNYMGYDAVAFGNHDWLQGLQDLDETLSRAAPKVPILAANFNFDREKYTHLDEHIKPSAHFQVGENRITVLGLTTSDLVYSWRARNGWIAPAIPAAWEQVDRLKGQSDFIIALSHLGRSWDHALAEKVAGIDLIVGGHSHHLLKTPDFAKNQKTGQKVPIVQAGKHGQYVGSLLVDLVRGKDIEVLRYDVVPVDAHGPKDETVVEAVKDARTHLENFFTKEWLYEVIGHSEVALEAQSSVTPTVLSQLITDAMKESAQTDVAIDLGIFEGIDQPAGAITREQLILLYPRVFDFSQKYGWNIWKIKIRGWLLKAAITQLAKSYPAFTLSGATYSVSSKGKISNIRINGKKVKSLKNYTMAVPEGIGRGADDIALILSKLFKDPQNTHVPLIFALENKIKKLGVVRKPAASQLPKHP